MEGEGKDALAGFFWGGFWRWFLARRRVFLSPIKDLAGGWFFRPIWTAFSDSVRRVPLRDFGKLFLKLLLERVDFRGGFLGVLVFQAREDGFPPLMIFFVLVLNNYLFISILEWQQGFQCTWLSNATCLCRSTWSNCWTWGRKSVIHLQCVRQDSSSRRLLFHRNDNSSLAVRASQEANDPKDVFENEHNNGFQNLEDSTDNDTGISKLPTTDASFKPKVNEQSNKKETVEVKDDSEQENTESKSDVGKDLSPKNDEDNEFNALEALGIKDLSRRILRRKTRNQLLKGLQECSGTRKGGKAQGDRSQTDGWHRRDAKG